MRLTSAGKQASCCNIRVACVLQAPTAKEIDWLILDDRNTVCDLEWLGSTGLREVDLVTWGSVGQLASTRTYPHSYHMQFDL